MSKKKKKAGRPQRPNQPARLQDHLREVEALLRRGEWVEADERLESLDKRYGGPAEVLALRMELAVQLKDFPGQLLVAERLVALSPNDPMLRLRLAAAYLNNDWTALALRTFHTFLERWPHHPDAEMARRAIEEMMPNYRKHLDETGLGGPDEMKLAARHEKAQVLLARGEFQKARETAARVIEARPHYAPPYNNSAQACAIVGDYSQAIDLCRRVLAFEPDNVHTLSNLVRFLCQSGRFDEAKTTARRLRELKPAHGEGWVKIAEALAALGNDAGVLRAAEQARQSPDSLSPGHAAFVEHLAAVAEYRLGRPDEAHRLWQQALRHLPNFEDARANLEDLRKPVGERHAPWPFAMNLWLPLKFITELLTVVQAGGKKLTDEELRPQARRFLEAHPEAERVTPALFDRGDPGARGWALHLAMLARTPFLLGALRDFALSQRGPDQQRMEAGRVASDAGLINGPVRFWVEGEWREVVLMGLEITGEPQQKHSPEVSELAAQAADAMYAGDGVEAERILRQALALKPDAPDLLNNLGRALDLQGRRDESLPLLKEIFERFPDYLFARVTMARMAILDNRLDEAEELLAPLLKRRKFHVSEFGALATAEIDLQLACKRPQGAVSWLEIWEQVAPDHPDLLRLKRELFGPATRRGRPRH